jgi:hypothetical protein
VSTPESPFEIHPPTTRRLVRGVFAAIVGALLILVLVVLPAEYAIDPTGIGKAMGLTKLNAGRERSPDFKDAVGGNERYREVKAVDPGAPLPLPNPAVGQIHTSAPKVETRTIRLEPGQRTEIKAVMGAAQVIVYTWQATGGQVYVDFHGHEPDAGDAFVRYEEQQSGKEGHGSLVAPFTGEHGWMWLNLSETPVTITLKLSGYHTSIKDYGLF